MTLTYSNIFYDGKRDTFCIFVYCGRGAGRSPAPLDAEKWKALTLEHITADAGVHPRMRCNDAPADKKARPLPPPLCRSPQPRQRALGSHRTPAACEARGGGPQPSGDGAGAPTTGATSPQRAAPSARPRAGDVTPPATAKPAPLLPYNGNYDNIALIFIIITARYKKKGERIWPFLHDAPADK